jgi:hypothetical protein
MESMTISDFLDPQNVRPAARDDLAAAGPVEPSSSPGLAPGPTLTAPATTCGEYFRRRKTPALVGEVRRLYRGGENYAGIARGMAVASDTARRWLDPDYDLHRRRRAAVAALSVGDADVPTLAFVPGIVISGRYRMHTPS